MWQKLKTNIHSLLIKAPDYFLLIVGGSLVGICLWSFPRIWGTAYPWLSHGKYKQLEVVPLWLKLYPLSWSMIFIFINMHKDKVATVLVGVFAVINWYIYLYLICGYNSEQVINKIISFFNWLIF